MPSELYLIGTLHRDSKGPVRLPKLLNHLQPDHVSIELDEERAARADEIEREYLQSEQALDKYVQMLLEKFPGANPETAKMYVKITGFGYFVSRDYCKEKKIPLVLSDILEQIDEKKIKKAKEKILGRNPKLLFNKDTIYNKNLIEIGTKLLVDFDLIGRDTFAEERIRPLNGRVVHVGGLGHIFGTYHNLYDRLKDLNPTRMRLNEADNL